MESRSDIVAKFKPYMKKGILGWVEMTSEEALVDDAPEEVKELFDKYVQKIRDLYDQGYVV